MRLLSPVVLLTLLMHLHGFTHAQNSKFAPFDCREHDEMDESNTEVYSASIVEPVLIQLEVSQPTLTPDTLDGWKTWTSVENYTFGKDRGSLAMISDIQALHPFFRDKVLTLISMCEKKGIELSIVETYRTPSKQHEYKTMGKHYTSSGAGQSKHQYGLAIDVVPMVAGKAVWDNAVLWRKLGLVGEKLGLRWGGRWNKPYDPGHFEWTGGLSSGSLYAGTFPSVPAWQQQYPCLEEDLRILRKHWREWEISQSSLTRK